MTIEIITLNARLEHGDFEDYKSDVVLSFGDNEIARWTVDRPYICEGETDEKWAAEFVAKKLAEVFALVKEAKP